MGVLDNFIETTNSDNRFEFCNQDRTEEIIIGGDVTHVYELPFIYSSIIESGSIIYQQGLERKWSFTIADNMIIENPAEGVSYIRLHLNPEITGQFKKTILTTYSQVKLRTVTGEIIFDKPHKIIVRNTLEI